MKLDTKAKFILITLALIVSFFYGRHVGTTEVEVTKTTDIAVNQERTTDTHKVIETVELPSGEKRTTTTIDTTRRVESSRRELTSEQVKPVAPTVNVSLGVEYNFKSPSKPNYAVGLTKEVLGPITASILYVTNGSIIVMGGYNF